MKRSPEHGELLKGSTPTLILTILESGPLHGYGIAREIGRRSAELLRPGEGSLYPALRLLEGDGLIVGSWEIRASGPARKVYALTDAGRAELARRVRSWREFARAMESVLGGTPDAQPA